MKTENYLTLTNKKATPTFHNEQNYDLVAPSPISETNDRNQAGKRWRIVAQLKFSPLFKS